MANSGHRHNSKVRLVVGIILLLMGGVVAASVLRNIIISYEVKNSFCTSNDEIYQTIQANLNTWIKINFRPNNTSSSNHLYFSTPNGLKYTAIGMEPDRFFVVTEVEDPHSYLGQKGYIYSPSDPSQNWSEYHYTPLGENLFCYESKF